MTNVPIALHDFGHRDSFLSVKVPYFVTYCIVYFHDVYRAINSVEP